MSEQKKDIEDEREKNKVEEHKDDAAAYRFENYYAQPYTAPTGKAKNSAVFSDPSSVQTESEVESVKRHRGRKIIILLILLFAASAGVWTLVNYDFSLYSDSDGFHISISRTGTLWDDPDMSQDPNITDRINANDTNQQESLKPNPGMQWDGTRLEITDEPSGSEVPETLSLQEIYKKCAPSVVDIYAVSSFASYSGTGIIMTSDGYIITNSHVVSDTDIISVTLQSQKEYEAVLVGEDAQSDLAVLKIEAYGLQAAEFGDSQALEVGDVVAAIGNPFEQSFTMTDGIISGINRDVSYNGYQMTLLQTNAAINEGNSGGPLINAYGQVIGIINMKLTSHYSTIEGIGFAIPMSRAKDIINELLENGYVSGRPAIGIEQSDISYSVSKFYGMPKGVYVSEVYSGTDAAEKGLARGDIITGINGTTVNSVSELDSIVNTFAAGDSVTLTVFRRGNYYEVDIVLADAALLS